jgi:hypothetical protein
MQWHHLVPSVGISLEQCVRLQAFTDVKCNKIFSDEQPCEFLLKKHHQVLSTLMKETDDTSETSVSNSTLTRLIAREYFSELEK